LLVLTEAIGSLKVNHEVVEVDVYPVQLKLMSLENLQSRAYVSKAFIAFDYANMGSWSVS